MPLTDPPPPRSGVCELRQYTLHPGRRDDLVDLFDRHFVETQEEVGIRVIGQFRDLDDPDRFVWLRAFPDMAARAESLAAFYERHPAWQEHRDAANDTMADSDDVLLLRPAPPGGRFPDSPRSPRTRPPAGAAEVSPPPPSPPSPLSLVEVTIHHLATPAELEEFAVFFDQRMRPVLTGAGAPPLAVLRSEDAENTFPKLPVRVGEHVFVSVTLFPDARRHREHRGTLASRDDWRHRVLPQLADRLIRDPEHLRLAPTPRSRLH